MKNTFLHALKMMNDLLKTLDANTRIQRKVVNRHFEEDDEDMPELGQIIEENTHAAEFFHHEMAGCY